MTTRDELTDLATRWIALWCAPVDWAAFDRLHAETFEDMAAAGRSATKAGFAAGLAAFVTAFPDVVARVEDLVIDEARGRVAVRRSARGTNAARYLGIGPTHRQTTITGIEIIEIADGAIVRRWGEWDITDHRPLDTTPAGPDADERHLR